MRTANSPASLRIYTDSSDFSLFCDEIRTEIRVLPIYKVKDKQWLINKLCVQSLSLSLSLSLGAPWLSGRVLESRPKGHGFEPHRRHCVVSVSKNINLSLVLVQPKKIRPFIAERVLMGRKESNQTNKSIPLYFKLHSL